MSEPRTRMSVEARRHQLLELGRELFGNRPYDAISIDEIAAVAGISKGLLYHYFPGKRELYLACVREAVEQMVIAWEPDPALPPTARLEASLDAYLAYIADHHETFRNLLRGGGDTDPEVERIMESLHRRVVQRLAQAVGQQEPSATLQLALLGWVGFVSFAGVGSALRPGVPRAHVRRLMADSLGATLRSAARLEAEPAVRRHLLDVVTVLEAGSADAE
jgi:AcrR family transcriptional regulator